MKKVPVILMCLVVFFFACSKEGSVAETKPAKTQTKSKSTSETFTASLVDGTVFNSADYEGERILLGFFSYKHRDALPMLQHFSKILSWQDKYNFRVVGVSIDANQKDGVQKFIKDNKIEFPIILDSPDLAIAKKFKVQNEVMLIGLGSDHKPMYGLKKYIFAKMKDGFEAFEGYMKENLGIHDRKLTKPYLGIYPNAPDFSFTTLAGKKKKLSDYKGKKAVLLLFFSPSCPHCKQEMSFLQRELYPEFKSKGLEILAASVLDLKGKAGALYSKSKFTWPTFDDHERKVRSKYSQERGVPENFLIGKDGKIYFVSNGYSTRKNDIYRMWIKRLLGLPNPPLLKEKHYNGVDTCMICHEEEYVSWAVTPHGHAWETLQIKGEDFNPECVQCHSLGFDDPKGYKVIKNEKTGKEFVRVPNAFQNVQCENCHGIGGVHLATEDMMQKDKLKETCLECHTEKFSLHFDFDKRLKKVDHSNAKEVSKLSVDERIKLLEKVSKTPDQLFGVDKKYVGSDSCVSCHADIHANWLTSSHKAPATLAGKTYDDIGCESCHGPGELHIKTKKKADIRGLGDDCPFCVVEQICLSCHDAKSSPNFNIHKGLRKIKEEHKY